MPRIARSKGGRKDGRSKEKERSEGVRGGRRVQDVLRAREGVEEEEEELALLLEVLRQLGPTPQVLLQGGYSWQGITFIPC